MKLQLYFDIFKKLNLIKDGKLEEVKEIFLKTFVKTNRTLDFFVDWNKVFKNVGEYKIELSILNSLCRANRGTFDSELKKILSDYPKVLKAIPILLAIRFSELNNGKLSVLSSIESLEVIDYNFEAENLSNEEIEKVLVFFEKTGLKELFNSKKLFNLIDYVTGVEVGMDTNARKNRSGAILEKMISPYVERVAKNLNFILETQKTHKYLKEKYGISIRTSINERPDFVLIKKDNNNLEKVIFLEVNFYSATGSKPNEIVDSYFKKQEDLKSNGYEFIWITDGDFWIKNTDYTREIIERIDYVLNIYLVKNGILEELLRRI